jgi:taurine dioxygenase
VLDHQPLKPLGAVLGGLRIDAIDRDTTDGLRRLLAAYGVIVIPHQEIDDDGFVRFLRGFGELIFTTGETPVPGFPDLNVISNVGRAEPPRSTFHTDTSYVRNPPAYTALRAVTVPLRGGQTLFTDQYAAYDTLPDSLRNKVGGRAITHVVTGLELGPDVETSATHPAFLRHPLSGRTALYLSTPTRCTEVSGLPSDDASDTIASLFAHSTREENVLRHDWSPGDVVMWDNRCVLHRADHHGVVGDRIMHRGMVAAGSSP